MTDRTEPDSTGDGRRRVSEVLKALFADGGRERLSIAEIESALAERSFGVMLLIVALLGLMPGVSMVAAIALLPICGQMMLGAKEPWLPGWLKQRSVGRAEFARVAGKAVPYLEKLERFLRTRYRFLTDRGAERLVGAACLILALFLLPPLPIPFSNLPFAFSIVILALSIIERDGLLTMVGLACGAFFVGGSLVLGWVAVQQALLWAAKYLGM